MTAEVVARAAAPAGVSLGDATVIPRLGLRRDHHRPAPRRPPRRGAGRLRSRRRASTTASTTAIGYLSIATKNHGGSTAISAGPATLAMALLEAATTVAAGEGPTVVAIAEEPLPPVLAESGGSFDGLAVALIVEAWRGQGIHARLSHTDPSGCEALPRLPPKLAANPCARAFAAAAALGSGRARQLALEPAAHGRAWVLEILDEGATKAR
ncbi:MAG: beta-ketoacyl synthase chain length factor [Nannocystaceae bacterium]